MNGDDWDTRGLAREADRLSPGGSCTGVKELLPFDPELWQWSRVIKFIKSHKKFPSDLKAESFALLIKRWHVSPASRPEDG